MIIDISDKVVVITGSSKGIGRSLALAFAKEKAKVVINYHNSKESAKQVYDEIVSFNPDCILVKANITKQEEVSKLYRETLKAYGRIDVLINNAGICDDNPIQLMLEEQWQKVLDVNLTGVYLCSRIFSKIMIQQNRGKIINISSLKGQEGCESQANYSASKAGLIGFTKALAKELGRFNISVNAVCPGFIITDLNRHNREKQEVAERRSLFPVNFALDDLTNFLIYISSEKIAGVSGRIFNLDSRIL